MTNLEMLELQRSPQELLPEVIERVGKIRFTDAAWQGRSTDGMDFPVMFGQLGMVPLDIQQDIRTKQVTVLYRWYGFPQIVEVVGEVPEYRVTVTCRPESEDGCLRHTVYRLAFMPVNNLSVQAQIVVVRRANAWIINPHESDLVDEPPEIRDTTPRSSMQQRREMPMRRIVIRP